MHFITLCHLVLCVQRYIKGRGRPKKEDQKNFESLKKIVQQSNYLSSVLASFAAMNGEEESRRIKLNNDFDDDDDEDEDDDDQNDDDRVH